MPPPQQPPKNQPQSFTGFPHLERLVEQDDFSVLNKTFMDAYAQLEAISKGKADAARKKNAQKAMVAMEHTMNLLREFLKVKEEMVKQGMRPPGAK